MSITNKTSILVPSQLPSFISEDVNYENFVAFVQAYYEWMEQNGIITSINVINGGLGYSGDVTITIDGDGTGANAYAILSNHGTVQEIVLSSYGSGYTYANVIIIGANQVPATATATIQNGVTYDSKNLLNYMDVDNTTQAFINYFTNEFMPYFPEDALVSKDKAIKIARQIYKSKGTPASYQLFFRMLYDSPFEYYNTGDLVLKSSTGNWFVPKSLSLLTTDQRFLNITNYKLFGETSKSFATVENSTLEITKEGQIQVFISNIERTFQSGEYVRVVDNNNRDYIVDGTNLRAKLVGQISSITVDPAHKGLGYVTGDPVIFYGGLNTKIDNPIGAQAVVGDVVTGSIQSISLLNSGQGYNLGVGILPNTVVSFTTTQSPPYSLPIVDIVDVDSANAFTVTGLSIDSIDVKTGNTNPSGNTISLSANNFFFQNGTWIQVTTTNTAQTYIVGETVYQGNILSPSFAGVVSSYDANTGVIKVHNVSPYGYSLPVNGQLVTGNTSTVSFTANTFWTSNIHSTIADVLTTTSYTGYPISQLFLVLGGSNLTKTPDVQTSTYYGVEDTSSSGRIDALGILGPIKISYAGQGYSINDQISFIGGAGFGAKAYVANVDSKGAITQTTYTSINGLPSGGVNYSLNNLPAVQVKSNTATANASLYVDSIIGQGAIFDLISSQIGQITNINIENYGSDYISAPKISLSIQDITISGVNTITIPRQFDTFYQGVSANATSYTSTVYSITQLGPTQSNPLNTVYRLRVFNYSSDPNPALPLISATTGYTYTMAGKFDDTWPTTGVIDYGDGSARATASFLNGLIIDQGKYLDSSGQLSSFDVIQSEDYNSFTYKITTQKQISQYRSILLNMLHPAGTKLLGRYSTTQTNGINFQVATAAAKANTLYFYTGVAAANVTMFASPNVTYQNVLQFNNLAQGTNIADFIFANSTIWISPTNYPNVVSTISNIDYANNQVTITDNTFLTFPDTFYVEYQGASNYVFVGPPTQLYTYNGFYGLNLNFNNLAEAQQSPFLPLNTLLFPGDYVDVGSNNYIQVADVDYANNIIILDSPLSSNQGIFSIPVTTGGSNYDANTTINIAGDGVGFSAVPIINNGVVTSISIANTGYGYTTAYATVVSSVGGGAVLGNVVLQQVTTQDALTIVRNFMAGGTLDTQDQVRIYGPAGQQYFPEITDELGQAIITEDEAFILLG